MFKRTLMTAAFGVLFIGASLSMVAVPQAQAADGKNLAGSMCVRWSGSTSIVYNASAIGNSSTTTTLYLDCPAVKDTSNTIQSGWVRAFDLHYSQNVRCSLNSVYANAGGGMWGWWGAFQSTSGSGAGAQQMNFGGLGSNAIAHTYYSCTVPPRYAGNTSYIATYNVVEN